jgi:hypothetical protein
VLLDQLVQPAAPVVDYLTRFSGLTAAMLCGVECTRAQAREKLLQLVPAQAVLVGHSLENDLKALGLVHERVLDTRYERRTRASTHTHTHTHAHTHTHTHAHARTRTLTHTHTHTHARTHTRAAQGSNGRS